MTTADVVIIGGGIIGLSSGYWLAKAGAKVVILEKGRVGWEASSRATGFLSLRGEQPLESPLAVEAERLWHTLDAELGSPTEWNAGGRLWAATTPEEWDELQETYKLFSETGIPFRLIEGKEARKIVPCLPENVIGGIHTTRSGHANPQRTTQAFAWAFVRHGGEILENTPAIGIVTKAGKVAGVKTPDLVIETATVVNCAGPQVGLVAEMVGVNVPVAAARLEAMVTVPLPPLFQVALVAHGLSLRQTRRGNIHFNGGPHEWIDVELTKSPAKPNTPIIRNMARRLAELFPSLANVQVLRSWGGVVEMTPDVNCIIERLDEPDGLIIATTSGHGFGMAPSVGLAISELALNGNTNLPIASLGLARFAKLDPMWKQRRNWTPGNYNT
ncbi:MAG TPA: FAD-dependent oxidoreductase [Aestuariivirga sp.]|nr:FAD-dependent oxidoreductase [Aestuariivirga sp.]